MSFQRGRPLRWQQGVQAATGDEIVERAGVLERKLEVIGGAATTLTDLIDTERSLRLELLIVGLIVAELVLAIVQFAFRR